MTTVTSNTERLRRITFIGSWLALACAAVTSALVVWAFVRWSSWLGIPVAVVGISGIGVALFTLMSSMFDASEARRGVRVRAGVALVVLVAEVVATNVLTLAAI